MKRDELAARIYATLVQYRIDAKGLLEVAARQSFEAADIFLKEKERQTKEANGK